jgi:Na+/H+ antiporter NhaA
MASDASASRTPDGITGGPPAEGRTAWARNLQAPVRDFLGRETGSAAVLVLAAVAALIWANSPWPHSYESVWHTELSINLGAHRLSADLRTWVNEGLMTLFFLVVGLEAKRELDLGELRDRARLRIPVIAAIGGMVVPIGLYLLFNAGGEGSGGWGAAMSTDTALALGALALVGPGGARLRVFLLTLAVVDDLVALGIITVAYTHHIDTTALGVALALFVALFGLRYLPHYRGPIAVVVGVALWVALFESGIDAVVAGLAIGLVTAAYPPSRDDLERATDLTRAFREQPTPELARTAQRSVASAISPNERLQHALHPWTSYVIVPIFALANAGIDLGGGLLSDALTSPITIGIVVAYVVGKPLGILLSAWIGTRRGGRLTLTWPGLAGTASTAGIGFTVSILIASLAFDGDVLDKAKVGILATAILSPLAAFAVFRLTTMLPDTVRQRQYRNTVGDIIDLAEDVDPAVDHVRGKPDAPVTLVEYADFECPYCGRAEPTVRDVVGAAGDDVRYVFRHLPLADVHPHAQLAAEAAEAAAAQGAFWEMHDLLMAHQDKLTLRDIREYAEQLGLDADRLVDEVRDRRYIKRINRDVESADASDVAGTPSFFINGKRHQGAYDEAALTAAVRAARLYGATRLQPTPDPAR